ncbi:hypothetical protein ACO0QE_003557 [Hanseniaspora vineae]
MSAKVSDKLLVDSATPRDYNHSTDAEYKRLRNLANEAYDKRSKLSQQSQQEFKSGNKEKAHELSVQAKEQMNIADQYNMQAAEYAFRENNLDSSRDEVDLHGLFVKEAQWIMQKRIANGVKNGESFIRSIVGKGNHSANGIAKLKPAIHELCQQIGVNNYIDPKNTGVLVVDLRDVSMDRIPSNWFTMDYSTFLHGSQQQSGQTNVQKPPQAVYSQQQVPQYQQQQQQQQQYHQQQPQQQYHQQQQNYNNANNNNNNNDLLTQVLKALCVCIQKNM